MTKNQDLEERLSAAKEAKDKARLEFNDAIWAAKKSGLSNGRIARALGMSEGAVRMHLSRHKNGVYTSKRKW